MEDAAGCPRIFQVLADSVGAKFGNHFKPPDKLNNTRRADNVLAALGSACRGSRNRPQFQTFSNFCLAGKNSSPEKCLQLLEQKFAREKQPNRTSTSKMVSHTPNWLGGKTRRNRANSQRELNVASDILQHFSVCFANQIERAPVSYTASDSLTASLVLLESASQRRMLCGERARVLSRAIEYKRVGRSRELG